MASPDNISLLDIFNLHMGSDKVIFVKNIPDGTDRDILMSYLAVVLNVNVMAVHYPADVDGCCVVVVHRPIRALWKYTKALSEQPLEENVIELNKLGDCEGLLIRNPPCHVPDEEFESYLRSDKFTGGTDVPVQEIKHFCYGTGRFFVAVISETPVIDRILNRPKEPGGFDLDIEPYFPAFHGLLEQGTESSPQAQSLSISGPQPAIHQTGISLKVHDHGYYSGFDSPMSYKMYASTEAVTAVDSDNSDSKLVIYKRTSDKTKEEDESDVKTLSMPGAVKEGLVHDVLEISDDIIYMGLHNTSGQATGGKNILPLGFEQKSTSELSPFTDFQRSDMTEDLQTEKHQLTASSYETECFNHSSMLPADSMTPARSKGNIHKKFQEYQPSSFSEREAFEWAIRESKSQGNPVSCDMNSQEESGDCDNLNYSDQPAKRDNPDPDPGRLHAVFRDESKSSFGKRDTEIPCSEKRSPHGNKNRYFLEKFQSGKSGDEALAEAIKKSMSETNIKTRGRMDRSSTENEPIRRRSNLTGEGDREEQIHFKGARAKQGQARRPVAPKTAQSQTRSSSEDRKTLRSHYFSEPNEKQTTFGSYEKVLPKSKNISDTAKTKIRQTLKRFGVKSIEDPSSKNYVLRGDKESVQEAFAQIQILLDDSSANETFKRERELRNREFRSKPERVTKYMALSHEPEVPEYWEKFKQGLISHAITSFQLLFKGKDYFKIRLKEMDPVYKAIIQLINKTWDEHKVGQGKDAAGLGQLRYRSMRVTKIERIENLHLYEKYSRNRKDKFIAVYRKKKHSCRPVEGLPDSRGPVETKDLRKCHVIWDEIFPQVNEHFFFHGTTEDKVDIICDKGLDFRVGSLNAMYGSGIYGAESPTKADQYADPQNHRSPTNRQMFLIRMVLGESFLCKDQSPHKYRRPPCANFKCLRDNCSNKSHGSFNSIVGQSQRLFREFVVYESDQCYPEYLITYDRV